MNKIIVFASVVLFQSCATTNSDQMQWNVPIDNPLQYSTLIGEYPLSVSKSINGFDLVKNKNLLAKTMDELRKVNIPDASGLISTLTKNTDNSINVKVTNGPMEFESPPQNKEEETRRSLLKDIEGQVQSSSNITNKGDILSFYLKQKDKNVVSMFYKLPDKSIQVGDSWTIPINMIEMGANYIAKDSRRINQVEVVEIRKDKQGEKIAIVQYIVAEQVDGHFVTFAKKGVDSGFTASFIAYGEFLLDQGHWKKFNGILATQGTGFTKNEAISVLALKLLKIKNPQEPH